MTHTDDAAPAGIADDPGIDPIGEFITTLFATPAHRLTACRGWTAHELVAHLAAGAEEEAQVIDAHLAGAPRVTRSFEEREPPFRALPDAALRDRLIGEVARLAGALATLACRPADEQVAFTGRPMTVADFEMHSRSECTLHRWDLVGRDEVGWSMLAQPSLTKHALGVLGAMTTLPEAPANRLAAYRGPDDVRVVLRSAPYDDVVVTIADGVAMLDLAQIDETAPDVELDASARLLLLWGRREPSATIDLYGHDAAARVVELLLRG